MKRFLALTISLLFVLSLCACGNEGNTTGTGINGGNEDKEPDVISAELQGTWYGPTNTLSLTLTPTARAKLSITAKPSPPPLPPKKTFSLLHPRATISRAITFWKTISLK